MSYQDTWWSQSLLLCGILHCSCIWNLLLCHVQLASITFCFRLPSWRLNRTVCDQVTVHTRSMAHHRRGALPLGHFLSTILNTANLSRLSVYHRAKISLTLLVAQSWQSGFRHKLFYLNLLHDGIHIQILNVCYCCTLKVKPFFRIKIV